MRRSSNHVKRFLRNLSMFGMIMLLSAAALPMGVFAAESTADYRLIDEVRELLSEYHLGDVSDEQLIEAAIRGMIESLSDPYSDYMKPDEWDSYENALEQNYVGIGIRLGEDEGGVFALDVFPDSPAYEAGMLRGDYIIEVNGTSVVGKSTDDIVSLITGSADSEVKVTISRNGERIDFTMTRRSVKIPNVENKWFPDGYGYIKIQTFSSDADEQFEEYMTKMKRNGLKGLVIDVRGNPGGYLDSVAYIAGEFIENGVVMLTRDKNGVDSPISIQNGYKVDVPVVILVDEHSASGSEVLAGALQDHQLAKVIGKQTYGKGSVQNLYFLSNGGVLKTTVQQYLTPNGHVVEGVGITPDIEVLGSLPQLITALREIGMHELTIESTERDIMINGINFNENLPHLVMDGLPYVHSRALAALMGLDVSWDDVKQQVVFIAEDQTTISVPASAIHLSNGLSYINLQSFADHVAGFTWSYLEGQLTISNFAASS